MSSFVSVWPSIPFASRFSANGYGNSYTSLNLPQVEPPSRHEILRELLQMDEDSIVWILRHVRNLRGNAFNSSLDAAGVAKSQKQLEMPAMKSFSNQSKLPGCASRDLRRSYLSENDLPSVQFAALEFHVRPDEEFAELQVTRTGNKEIRSEVQYKTQDLNAKAGQDYEATEGTIVFEPGEDVSSLFVGLLERDTWETLVDFTVDFVRETAVGATVGRQLGNARVKMIGTETFPSAELEEILEEDPALDSPHSKIKIYVGFLSTLWSNSTIRSGTIKRCLQGQLHNISFIILQYMNVFLINDVFKASTDDKIWILTPYYWIIVIVCVIIIMHMVLHCTDYVRLSWSVGGAARKLIQKAILRRFMYFDMNAREGVRSSDLSLAVTRDAINVCSGYGKVIDLANVFGGILAILIFKITAPFIFRKPFSILGFIPFVLYPFLLGAFIRLRADTTTDALEEVESKQNLMLEYVYQAVDCYYLISDYRRRQEYVEALVEYIDAYNLANREKNQLVTNNTKFPQWISMLFIVFWYLYFGQLVIEGPLSLGFFLADVKVIEKFGQQFEKLYEVVMDMEATFPDLARIVGILNKPTDLEHRLSHERYATAKTETLRKAYEAQEADALDAVPIIVEDLQFSFHGFSPCVFNGRIEIKQGQMVCFVGAHGHGKSTLLKVIAGSQFPELEAGEVFIPAHLRVLHVSLDPHFLHKSLFDNLVLGAETEQDRSVERVSSLLSRLRLERLIPALNDNEYFWQSGLTKHDAHTLNLARALIANPHVLAIHKPTMACSDVAAKVVMDLLREFVKERGFYQDSDHAQRRPRTLLYTSLRRMSCEAADTIYHVTPGKVQSIPLDSVTEDIFGQPTRRMTPI